MVLGAAHRLKALAVGNAVSGDDSAGVGLADKGDAGHLRMLDQGGSGHLIAVDHVEHPRRQADLVDAFGDQLHRHRHQFGRLQDEGIAGGNGVRKEPERRHRRKVEGSDRRKDPPWQTQHLSVDAPGAAEHLVTLLQHRHAAGHLHVLDGALHLGPGVWKRLAHLTSEHAADLLLVFAQQIHQRVHELGALRDRSPAPFGKGRPGRPNRPVDFACGRKGHLSQSFAGARILDIEKRSALGLYPFPVDVVFYDSIFHTLLSSSLGYYRLDGKLSSNRRGRQEEGLF